MKALMLCDQNDKPVTLEVLVEKKIDVDKFIKMLGSGGGEVLRKVVRRFIIQVGKFEWGEESENNSDNSHHSENDSNDGANGGGDQPAGRRQEADQPAIAPPAIPEEQAATTEQDSQSVTHLDQVVLEEFKELQRGQDGVFRLTNDPADDNLSEEKKSAEDKEGGESEKDDQEEEKETAKKEEKCSFNVDEESLPEEVMGLTDPTPMQETKAKVALISADKFDDSDSAGGKEEEKKEELKEQEESK